MTRANQRKHHYIYKITRHDGKYYIGMHSTDDLEDGYFGSGQLLWKSIKKHGKEKHSKEILEHLPTREMLKLREAELVNEEILDDPLCMNLKLGGEGGSHGREAEVWRRDGFKEQNVPLLAEGIKRKWQDPQYHAKMVECAKARWERPEYRAMMNNASFTGQTHSDETKARIGAANSVHQRGANNSNFGKRWVTKDGKAISVMQSEVQAYLDQGFRLGRK